MDVEICQECRGLILDEDDNWKAICYPYKKFFNYNEPLGKAIKMNWTDVNVYEKIDGSLATLYLYVSHSNHELVHIDTLSMFLLDQRMI